jgi:hypothetical protein
MSFEKSSSGMLNKWLGAVVRSKIGIMEVLYTPVAGITKIFVTQWLIAHGVQIA